MNENENIRKTDEELSAEVKSLQGKSLIGKVLLIFGIIGAIISGLLSITPLVIVCFILLLAGGIISSRFSKKIKELVGSGIFQRALEDVFDDVDYRPFEHLSSEVVDSADFRFNYDKIEGNDYVKATYKGMGIEMSDIGLISVTTDSDGHRQESHVFRGLWMICDFGKELSADVRVCERSKLGKALGKGGIKTENEAFNKQFNIRSENQEEAFYILTPHMMEYIISMDDKANAKTNLSFLRSGKLHIALNSNRDSFEVKGMMSDAAKIREQFVDEIRQVTDLIDELRLVDTAFKD